MLTHLPISVCILPLQGIWIKTLPAITTIKVLSREAALHSWKGYVGQIRGPATIFVS